MQRLILPLALAALMLGCRAGAPGCCRESSQGAVAQSPAQHDERRAKTAREASPPPHRAPSARLGTFVDLDWDAFPRDPGPRYEPEGRVWVVSPRGHDSGAGTPQSPLRRIATAVARAEAGDLIRVHGGTYAEGMPGDYRALILARDRVVLTAAPGERVTLRPQGDVFKYGISITGDGVVVNGIDLEGFLYAIQVGRADRTQRGVVISNLTVAGAPGGGSEGIIAYDDNTAKGYASLDGLLIKNVTLRDMYIGISCNSGPCRSWKLDNVKVTGQGGSGSGADAVAIENGDNFLFHRVEVSQVAADGIDTKATRVVVWGCHVHHVRRNGIKLWHGGDIINTLVHHTGADAAIVTHEGPRVRLLHSVVAYHNHGGNGYGMTFGYDSGAPHRVEIINSIVYKNSGGIFINPKSQLDIRRSLISTIGNGDVMHKGERAITLRQGPRYLKRAGFGGGNVFADPQLDDRFRLRRGSPAIDRGLPLPAAYPATDALGRPRVKGRRPDLGPFEDH